MCPNVLPKHVVRHVADARQVDVTSYLRSGGSRWPFISFHFDSLPPIEGGERTLAGRLEREMHGLTSMAWDDNMHARAATFHE